MKRFWSSNLATLANQESTTSSCIDNFRFCLSINKNIRIIRFQWMNQTTKRKAPSEREVLTRTTRKDKHRKYRPISEMRQKTTTYHQGRFQDLWLGGAWVGEGSGDRLRSPAGTMQSPVRGPRGEAPWKLWSFEELQTFIWTTILNQPHHFYQTKKTWLWVLILSDNC
jgi:hypothetical protein